MLYATASILAKAISLVRIWPYIDVFTDGVVFDNTLGGKGVESTAEDPASHLLDVFFNPLSA